MDTLILANAMLFLSTLSLRRATDGLIASANFCKFLSTLSLRRATNEDRYGQQYWRFLSTLSLRRATYLINTYHRIFGISIHALLAESDAAPQISVILII